MFSVVSVRHSVNGGGYHVTIAMMYLTLLSLTPCHSPGPPGSDICVTKTRYLLKIVDLNTPH